MLMNYYCYILFFPLILLSNLLILSTSTWFSMWMLMEINMINFISLILFEKKMMSKISMLYFLTQSFNSYLFIMSMIMIQYNFFSMQLMLMFSMINKLGLPPFYQWYIKMISKINWMNIFLLTTLQKIIPLYILNTILNMFKMNSMMMMLIIYTSMISTFKALNSMNIKMLMAYSSMIQISWMLMTLMINEKISINYFIIYSIISLNLSFTFYIFKILNIQDLLMIKNNNPMMFMLMMMTLLSLSGLPPFFGFMSKWISIQTTQMSLNFLFLNFMMMISLMNMFFYGRICVNLFLLNNISMKFNFKYIKMNNSYNYHVYFMNWISLISLMTYQFMF